VPSMPASRWETQISDILEWIKDEQDELAEWLTDIHHNAITENVIQTNQPSGDALYSELPPELPI